MDQVVLITVLVAVVAVSVAVVPILAMLRSEHRHLHGASRHWIRRHGRRASVYELPRMYNQTTDEEQQELV